MASGKHDRIPRASRFIYAIARIHEGETTYQLTSIVKLPRARFFIIIFSLSFFFLFPSSSSWSSSCSHPSKTCVVSSSLRFRLICVVSVVAISVRPEHYFLPVRFEVVEGIFVWHVRVLSPNLETFGNFVSKMTPLISVVLCESGFPFGHPLLMVRLQGRRPDLPAAYLAYTSLQSQIIDLRTTKALLLINKFALQCNTSFIVMISCSKFTRSCNCVVFLQHQLFKKKTSQIHFILKTKV